MAHLNATLFFKKANLQEFKGQSERFAKSFSLI